MLSRYSMLLRQPCRGLLVLMLLSGPALADSSTVARDAWPGFRGPNVDGIVSDTSVFSGRDGVTLKVAWKRLIGSGYSGIAVADGTVVTMFSDGKSDVVAAFDEATGKEKWRFEMDETYEGHDGSHTGPISTPLIGDGRVFALSPRGKFFALKLEDGERIWSSDLTADFEAKKPHYGFGTSPILLDGVVAVLLGAENAAVAGFDPATGEKRWAVGDDTIGYQTPIIWDSFGRKLLVAGGMKKLLGVDARSGEVIWDYEHGGGGARGVASLVPVPAGPNRLFLAYKDDASTVVEFAQSDEGLAVRPIWEDRSIRNSYNVPVYHDGYVYAYSSRFLTCVDAGTGKAAWRSRAPGDGFLMLVDGHLLIVTKEGSVHVAKAAPDAYQEIARVNVFNDLSWTPPAFAHGHIYVRSLGELARIDVQEGGRGAKTEELTEGLPETSAFARFLRRVEAASDKDDVVDEFMAAHDQFPIIEGDRWVHFVYRGQAKDLAVAGDLFGARQEQPMQHLGGTDLFWHSMKLAADTRANYLFIKDFKEVLDPRNPRKTSTMIYGKEMEMSFSGAAMDMSWFAMPKWRSPDHLQTAEESRRGRLEQHDLKTELVDGGCTLDVYVPAGYDQTERRYAVAYVHGGRAALNNGKLTTSLDNIIGTTVDPIIAVFIHARARGQDEKYAEMLATELVPFVDEKYRTIPDPGARANIGHGFAAHWAFYTACAHPGLIGKIGAQSAFIFSSMKDQLTALMQDANSQPLDIYLDWGKYDLRNPHEAWDLAQSNREFAQALRGHGYKIRGGEMHDGTGWSAWRNRTDRMFAALFPLGSTPEKG